MKKNLFMTVAAAALLLSGCDYNDKYFEIYTDSAELKNQNDNLIID